MARATHRSGELIHIENCYVDIPSSRGTYRITVNNLPDIGDSKGVSYTDQSIQGRVMPIKGFASGENRTIPIGFHFYVTHPEDVFTNVNHIRALQGALYTRSAAAGAPFVPPPVCRLYCGRLLADHELCVILTHCDVKFPTDVVWDEEFLVPYQIDVNTSWQVVYNNTNLPGQDRIMVLGG